jgi:hypothetical protein
MVYKVSCSFYVHITRENQDYNKRLRPAFIISERGGACRPLPHELHPRHHVGAQASSTFHSNLTEAGMLQSNPNRDEQVGQQTTSKVHDFVLR